MNCIENFLGSLKNYFVLIPFDHDNVFDACNCKLNWDSGDWKIKTKYNFFRQIAMFFLLFYFANCILTKEFSREKLSNSKIWISYVKLSLSIWITSKFRTSKTADFSNFDFDQLWLMLLEMLFVVYFCILPKNWPRLCTIYIQLDHGVYKSS